MRIRPWLLLLALALLAAAPATAQTVVSPVAAEFDDADFAAQDNGQPVVLGYVFELWPVGADTTTQQPTQLSQQIAKAQSTAVAGGPVTRRRMLITTMGMQIPLGPSWIMTVKSVGPGGSARSAASNPFNFPLPVRVPKAVTGLTVVAQ